MNGLALLLASGAAAWSAATGAPAGQVKRSTAAVGHQVAASTATDGGRAPLDAAPQNVPEIKRRINADQDEVLRARNALKRAAKSRNAAAEAKARDEWLKAKERLKADRQLLKAAILAGEEEQTERQRMRQELRKHENIRP